MNHRLKLSVALVQSLVLLLIPFALSAQGQEGGQRLVADTGVMTPGSGQKLRLTVNGQAGNDALTVRFRRMYYSSVGPDIHGNRKYTLAAQDTSAPIALAGNEAVWIDIDRTAGFDAVRGIVIVRGYRGTTNVNNGIGLQLINANGEVQSILIALLVP